MKTLWAALMEPNRLHIVELLRDGPLTVGEITQRLGLQQPQVSKHLKVLSERGGAFSRCRHWYAASDEHDLGLPGRVCARATQIVGLYHTKQ